MLEELDLRDTVLAGCGSGTGEVTRYLGTFGQRRVRGAALLAPLRPFPPRSAAGPGRVGETSSTISTASGQNSFHVAIRVSAAAALGCAMASREDFRIDLARITVPVLIVQGDQDRVIPPGAAGDRLAVMLADPRFVVIPEGPHAITWTHAAEVNRALLGFLRVL